MGLLKTSLLLTSVAAITCFSGVSIDAANTNAMPKAAPDFRKAGTSANLKPKPTASAVQSSDFAGATSFRVQTKDSPQAPLQGNVDQISVNPGGHLQGLGAETDSVIKTSPMRAQASATPPEVFRGWLEQAHSKFAARSSTLSPNTVLEVKGVYDNSSKTLRSLGIPFQQVKGADLQSMLPGGTRVVVVNCPGRVPRESLQQVRDFVANGGFVLSTDWSSDNLIEQAFPGYIKWDRHSNKQAVYDAEIVKPDATLFARTVTNASWKMDIDSHMIKTLRPDVRVLAKSRQLQAEDPACDGILAVVFPFGRGYVMHLVGHFDNNTVMAFRNMLADPAPAIGISLRQALATNFVVAGIEGTRIPIK